MSFMACEIHRTAKGVQHTSVHRTSPEETEPLVECLGITASEIADGVDAELTEIVGQARTNARDSEEVRSVVRSHDSHLPGIESA